MSRSPSRGGAARSRRRFLQQLGAASAAVPLAGLWPALAQTPPPAKSAAPAPPPAPAPAPAAADKDPQLEADARDLLEIVKRRFGSRLDAKQLDSVRDDLQDNLGASRALRKLDVRNSDEPDVVFRAEPPEV